MENVLPTFASISEGNSEEMTGMCPHLGYNYTQMQFGGVNMALTYYAEYSPQPSFKLQLAVICSSI